MNHNNIPVAVWHLFTSEGQKTQVALREAGAVWVLGTKALPHKRGEGKFLWRYYLHKSDLLFLLEHLAEGEVFRKGPYCARKSEGKLLLIYNQQGEGEKEREESFLISEEEGRKALQIMEGLEQLAKTLC